MAGAADRPVLGGSHGPDAPRVPAISGPADVWGAGAPIATALAAALRLVGVDATCVDALGGRLGGPPPALIFPVLLGRGEAPRAGRERLVRDAVRLSVALAEGQLSRVIVLSSTAAYGPAQTTGDLPEDAPLTAVEDGTTASDARAVEAILGCRSSVTVLRHAFLLGPGCEEGLLARHLAGPRLLVVRGTTPRWQVCHLHDLAAAIALVLSLPASALDGPAVVASSGVLSQAELEVAAGRRRLELPLVVAEATAARLHRTRLAPGASAELPYLSQPIVIAPARLAALGFVPAFTAAQAVREHQAMGLAAERSEPEVGAAAPGAAGTDSAGTAPSGTDSSAPGHGAGRPQAVRLASATVAAVGSAALLRRARRSRGR